MFDGKLKPSELHPELINKTYDELEKGAAAGYGKSWLTVNERNSKTVQELKQNIYKFSGAKTYQQLAEMNSFLVDDDGKIRNFTEFKRKVNAVHVKYNSDYLQAEYQTAKRSAQSSRQWKTYQDNKDLFPNLKYLTVADDKVRQKHQELHEIIKPVDDPFWDTYYPPNGWRCRCYVQPTSEDATTRNPQVNPDKGFAGNVGKTNEVFESKHPYFTYPAGDEKDVKTSFEQFKLLAPYGKARYVAKKAKVYVSPFADTSKLELIGNYKVAIKIAEELNLDVRLRPHVTINGKKNPEYLIGDKLADRKSPEGKSLRNLLRKAKEQDIEVLVLDLNNTSRKEAEILNELAGKFRNPENYSSIKEVIVVSKDRKIINKYKREDIKKSKK